MTNILVLDNLSQEGIDVFQAEGFNVDVKPPQQPEELAAIIDQYDGLVIRSATKVTAEALTAAKNLKVIGRAGVGTDNIDKNTATEMGIVVMNTPGGNTISTCEHAFALLFALLRNITPANVSMHEDRWDRKKFMGTEICGKTIGIIGLGRIGGAVAKRAQAFEMKVIAFDPIMTPDKAETLGIELVTLEELYKRSDIVTIHAPKSDKTNNMIQTEQLEQMKPTAILINCARGGIVNENDLAEALKNKTIAGAALDVYTTEPFKENPFIGLDNIVMTPHLAASTGEAQLTVAVDVARQMADYLKTGAIINAVNVPSLDSETRKKLQPLLYLSEMLGQFQSMYVEGTPTALKIDYSGDVGITDTYPITAAILTGFLRPKLDSVNVVSAPSLIKAHGITYTETKSAGASDYAFEIGVTVTVDDTEHTVKGTLFEETDPRICSIGGVRVNAKPEGHMLVCTNDDVPLIMAQTCAKIGEAGINIANLTLGRQEAGGRAMMVFNLDQPITEDVIESIRQLPHITKAGSVTFLTP